MALIQDLIDKSLLEYRDKEKHIPSGKFKPSSLGFCFRRQYWERLGEAPSNPPDDRTFRIFKVGNIFEKFVVDEMERVSWKFDKQTLVEDSDFKGYADIVEENCVTDVKSQHSRKFWHVKKELESGKSIVDIFIHNFLQVGFYALKLGKENLRLVFISKDDLCINEYQIELKVIKETLVKEIGRLLIIWGEKKLPPAEPRLWGGKETRKECDYCSFKDKCIAKENT